jgi:FKBP-type peptidyl-prolyl cis-trans isomerase FkpA
MKRIMLTVPVVLALVLAPAGRAGAQTGRSEPTTGQPATPANAGKRVAPGVTDPQSKGPSRAAGTRSSEKPSSQAPPMTEDEKAIFALGVRVGEQSLGMVKPLQLDANEIEAFKKGLASGMDGKKSPYPFEQYQQRLNARAESNMARESAANNEKGMAFRTAAASEPGATKSASGLVYQSLQPGQGESPKATDVVRVNYRGTLIDGTEFDSSKGGPASFSLTGVVPCWTEGLVLMKVGEKAKLVCPPELAYGDRPHGPIAAGSTLVFEVELVGIGAVATPATTPAN